MVRPNQYFYFVVCEHQYRFFAFKDMTKNKSSFKNCVWLCATCRAEFETWQYSGPGRVGSVYSAVLLVQFLPWLHCCC